MNLKPVLIFDIETTRTTNPAIIERIKEKIKPPATLKKAESIQEWWATQAEQALDEKLAQTALNGLQGDVTAIGWHIAVTDSGDDMDYKLVAMEPTISVRDNEERMTAFLGRTYRQMETELAKYFSFRGGWDVRVSGHNVTAFDLPFMRQQSLRYNVRHMRFFPRHRDYIFDTMTELAGYKEFISLQDAAITLGIPWDKDSIPGSDIPKAWDEGNHEAVIRHLRNDVNVTAAIALRLLSFNAMGTERD
jgi:hypothetical protein